MIAMRSMLSSKAGRIAAGALAVITLATLIGLIALWPRGEEVEDFAPGITADTERAKIIGVSSFPCPAAPDVSCSVIEAELREPGPGGERRVEIDVGDSDVFGVGDQIRVHRSEAPGGGPAAYSVDDFERRAPIIWLALAFGAIVVVFGRLRGALSLAGLIGGLAIVLAFIVPAIAAGTEPLPVAVIGALAVMLVTISLAHGLGAKSVAAMLATTVSLLLVAVLASLSAGIANLTGGSAEGAQLLESGSDISIQGLLIAGMVIGALGVLDDVTVSQSATVFALRSANRELSFGELYRRAIDVGRDHIAAVVNTLVLAYSGAALPVLLIFSAGDVGFMAAVNRELVAKEIVAMLVGSIGLIAAVPLTTFFAGLLASSLPRETLEAEAEAGHAHAH